MAASSRPGTRVAAAPVTGMAASAWSEPVGAPSPLDPDPDPVPDPDPAPDPVAAPDPDAVLKDSDTLLVAGRDEDLARAAREN